MPASITKELVASLPAKTGLIADVTAAIRTAGVNLEAISAYESDGLGRFLIVTDNNTRAAIALELMGAKPYEKQVVLADIENRPGALEEVTRMLSDAGINLEYVYGASGIVGNARFVLATTDDEKACSLL